jgi:hypothetical protein
MAGGEHPVARPQTARLLRPLRRRADRIARPARVRIRRRKPCTLCRRRLFGWYVRLLTSSSPKRFVGVRSSTGSHDATTSPVTRTTGTARPREDPLPPCQRRVRRGSVVDMRHRSNRSRPANGTRRVSTGSIRARPTPERTLPGAGERPNRRSSQWQSSFSARHADGTGIPVENRLPGGPGVVSVRAPDTPETWTSALNSAPLHPAHPVDKGVDRHKWTNRRNSCGLDLRNDVSDEGNARRTWSQQRTVESSMSCGPPSWTAWLPTSACGSRRASR